MSILVIMIRLISHNLMTNLFNLTITIKLVGQVNSGIDIGLILLT